MKARSIVLLSIAAILFGGCLVKSLNPFYTEGDIVFETSFIGSWLDTDSCLWEIEQYQVNKGLLRKKDTLINSYYIEYTVDQTKNIFEAHLFKLDGELYMDFTPIMDKYFDGEFYSLHVIPVHSLAKVSHPSTDSLKIQWYSEEWLSKLIEEKQTKLSNEFVSTMENSESIVLTGPTKELQSFIRKHGNDPGALNCERNDGICISLVKQ